MKKILSILSLLALFLVLGACGDDEATNADAKKEETPKEEVKKEESKTEKKEESKKEEKNKKSEKEDKPSFREESEANASEYPATPGRMLYDKSETKFKGMNYYFKGEIVTTKKVEGLFDNMKEALLVKNEDGYVMPIFPPYELKALEGDEVEAWGPLSGDGYESAALEVDNVVGVTGAMNASEITINGETK
ncbi:hypothetical protein [Peribacillus muralis]|uniref:hypothetical protein n=1 Tax=Peribacillus muralis TaxID=264697 RepID=UPI003D067CB1